MSITALAQCMSPETVVTLMTAAATLCVATGGGTCMCNSAGQPSGECVGKTEDCEQFLHAYKVGHSPNSARAGVRYAHGPQGELVRAGRAASVK